MNPGIYDIPAAKYHAGEGVSKSMLDKIDPPARLRAYLDEPKEEPTPAMLIGTLAHTAILEPDQFRKDLSHYVRPEGLTFQTKEGKAWRDGHQDKPIITASESDGIAAMVDSVRSHPIAKAMLRRGSAEQSVYATHQPTGLLRRGRIDWLTEDANGRPCIVDLKTTEDAREFERKIAAFRYHVQNAYYVDLMDGVGTPDAAFIFVVVEKSAPWGVRIVQLDAESVQIGRDAYELELAIYAECHASGVWPGYSPEITTVSLPAWAKRCA